MNEQKENNENNENNEIIIFNSDSGDIEVNIDVNNETVWLSQNQMATMFETSIDNVSLHIKNIYAHKEIDQNSTVEDFSIVRLEGKREVKRTVKHYNLDVIISVGYRVNSKKGVQFRQWSNKILKDHLIKGYSVNEKKLKAQSYQIKQLEKTLSLIQSVEYNDLSQSESSGLLTVLSEYTHSFVLLNQYDSDNLNIDHLSNKVTYAIDYLESLNGALVR